MAEGVLQRTSVFSVSAASFSRLAWAATLYNVFVMIWGAVVRASGSGAGCGDHWPLCNGKVLPREPAVATLIEFTHRLTSGLALIAVLALVYCAFKSFSRGHLVRKLSLASFVFIVIEALIGAGIVLARLVGEDESVTRGVSMGVHLVNTFLLLGALTLTAWVSSQEKRKFVFEKLFQPRAKKWRFLFFFGYFLLAMVGVSGAIAALGDTLFPATSTALGQGVLVEQAKHIFLELRIYHPIVAVGASLWWLGAVFVALQSPQLPKAFEGNKTMRTGIVLSSLIVLQLLVGIVNVWLMAPIWMQLVHLFISDLVVCACVVFSAGVVNELRVTNEPKVRNEPQVTNELKVTTAAGFRQEAEFCAEAEFGHDSKLARPKAHGTPLNG